MRYLNADNVMDYVAKIYVITYVISDIYIAFTIISQKRLMNEFSSVTFTMDRIEVFFLLIANLFVYLFLWCFYKKTQKKMITYKGFPKLEIDNSKVHIFVTVALLIRIAGNVFLNIGKVGANATTSFSFLFNIIAIKQFFPIYYIICRNKYNKNYWINLILFSLLEILNGWTGFVLNIGFIELYFRVKDKKFIYRKIKRLTCIGSVFIVLVSGSFIYKFLYPLKYIVRYNNIKDIVHGFELYSLPFSDAASRLLSRISSFSHEVLAVMNMDELVYMYKNEAMMFQEIMAMFRPLVPSALMPNKYFRSLTNLVVKTVFSDLEQGTGTDFGIFNYGRALFMANPLEFMIYIILFFILFVLVSSLLHSFDNEDNDISILYLIFLMSLKYNGTLEQVFSTQYIGMIYILIIMWLLGILKVKRTGTDNAFFAKWRRNS